MEAERESLVALKRVGAERGTAPVGRASGGSTNGSKAVDLNGTQWNATGQ